MSEPVTALTGCLAPIDKTGLETLIENGKLFSDLGIPPLNVETDRAMICGSMEMTKDISTILKGIGMKSGTNSRPAEYVVERAFVG